MSLKQYKLYIVTGAAALSKHILNDEENFQINKTMGYVVEFDILLAAPDMEEAVKNVEEYTKWIEVEEEGEYHSSKKKYATEYVIRNIQEKGTVIIND